MYTQASAFDAHTVARGKLDSGERENEFIHVGGETATGPARIERLMGCIKAAELRIALNRKEPHHEVADLLRWKHELLESMMFL